MTLEDLQDLAGRARALQEEVNALGAGPPQVKSDVDPRCWRCGRRLGSLLTRPWAVRCPKCHADNASAS